MALQKNVASQKIGWLMVDSTDFASPETGITVTAKYWKDGGGLSTCSNTVSECTSGLYRVTLAQTETNADFLAFQMTGAGCADQWLIFYPEDGYAAGISDLISNVSNVLSTLDDNVADSLSSILTDTATTLDNKLDSILVDTGTTIDNKVDSILVDTGTTLVGSISDLRSGVTGVYSALSDFEATIVSDVTAVYSALSDFEATAGGDTTEIKSDITAVYSALSDFEAQHSTDVTAIKSDITAVYSALSDFEAANAASVSDIKSAVDDIESNLSNAISTLDGPIHSTLDAIHSTVDTIGGDSDNITSILADTKSLLVDVSDIKSAVDDIESNLSNAISTLDGPIISDLSNIESIVVAQGTSGSADWSAKEQAQIRSALGVSGSTSALQNYGTNSRLDNATYGLDALETITSDILALGGGSADWTASERAQIRSALGVSGSTSALENYGANSRLDNATYGLNALETLISDVLSTIDGPVNSDLSAIHSTVDVLGGDSNNITSILADTKSLIVDVSDVRSGVTAVKSSVSDVLAMSTGNSNIISQILVDTATTLDNKIDSILVDTGTTLPTSISDIKSAVDDIESNLSNAISTLDGPIHSTLDAVHSTIDGPIDSAVTQNTGLISDILSTVDGPVISTLDRNQTDLDALIVDVSDVQSAVDITKKVVANKMIINETSGNVKLFADDDTTSTLVTSGMTTDGTDTTRKQLR